MVASAGDADLSATITFAVECKQRDGGGLVVFYPSDPSAGSTHTFPARSRAAGEFVAVKGQRGIGDHDLLRGMRGSPGYALQFLPRKQKERDTAFDAVHQVISAAHALSDSDTWVLVYPVIVTNVQLFRCELNSDGDPQLSEADRGLVRWPHPRQPNEYLTVHVVHEERLADFVADAAEASYEVLREYRLWSRPT